MESEMLLELPVGLIKSRTLCMAYENQNPQNKMRSFYMATINMWGRPVVECLFKV